MAKSVAYRTSSSGQFVSKSSAEKSDLKTFREVAADLRKQPGGSKTVIVNAGIATPSGRLKKVYGGK